MITTIFHQGLYFTGDGCRRDEDGYYWITGRVDDVINVSGHRLLGRVGGSKLPAASASPLDRVPLSGGSSQPRRYRCTASAFHPVGLLTDHAI
jgi:hypothetical protein